MQSCFPGLNYLVMHSRIDFHRVVLLPPAVGLPRDLSPYIKKLDTEPVDANVVDDTYGHGRQLMQT